MAMRAKERTRSLGGLDMTCEGKLLFLLVPCRVFTYPVGIIPENHDPSSLYDKFKQGGDLLTYFLPQSKTEAQCI